MKKSKNVFETDSFNQLKNEWYGKLKESGFDDIESTETDTVIRPQIFTIKQGNGPRSSQGPEYYEFCQQVLREYQFKRDMDKVVFELHTEGRTVREIEDYLKTHSFRPLTYTRIYRLIEKIKQDFGRS